MKILIILILLIPSLSFADGSLYDYSTKQGWDDLYDIGAESAWGRPNTRPEVRLNYHRFVIKPITDNHAVNLKRVLGWTNESTVLVVQCGFGWILESLGQIGVVDTKCTQTSPYIQTSKDLNEDADIAQRIVDAGLVTNVGDGLTIFNALRGDGGARAKRSGDLLNEDLDSNTSRQRVRTALGGPGFDVITYDGYLNTHTDIEAANLSDRLHRMPGVGRVIHHVYRNFLNGKSLDDWKLLLPNDVFVEAITYDIRN